MMSASTAVCEAIMPPSESPIPDLDHDPVFRLLLQGQAQTVTEAEEMVLNASLPEVIRLLQSPLSDEELGRHPLLAMFRRHGSRGWEDSLL
jgi:hypothetical protein